MKDMRKVKCSLAELNNSNKNDIPKSYLKKI